MYIVSISPTPNPIKGQFIRERKEGELMKEREREKERERDERNKEIRKERRRIESEVG